MRLPGTHHSRPGAANDNRTHAADLHHRRRALYVFLALAVVAPMVLNVWLALR